MAYTKPKKWKKEGERLRGEGPRIKFIDCRFEWGMLYNSGSKKKVLYKLHVPGMNDDLWDSVRGLGSET